MIPIKQTLFGFNEGNCFQACIASIFELPLDSIPHFCKRVKVDEPEDEWFRRLQEWLTPYGLTAVCIGTSPDISMYKNTYAILSGKSPRGCFLHSVVWRNGEIVHDPHPDNTGLEINTDFIFFVVRNPAKFMRLKGLDKESGEAK